MLELLSRLVFRPFPASNISAAVLYHIIEKYHPTLLCDEVDRWLKGENSESITGIINAGNTNNAFASVLRMEKDQNGGMIERRFDVRGHKVFGGIGKPDDTIVSRCIVIKMRRMKPEENVEDLLVDTEEELFAKVNSQLARLAQDYREPFIEAHCHPNFPPSLRGRKKDLWRSILAAADIIGGSWPDRARQAATSASNVEEAQNDLKITLLSHIQTVLQEQGNPDRIGSTHLAELLNANEEWPWQNYRGGKGIDASKLTRLLSDFQITSSKKTRIGGDSLMGYERTDFEDAFARYLSVSDPIPPLQSGTLEQTSKFNELSGMLSGTVPEQHQNQSDLFRMGSGTVPDENCSNSLELHECSGVPEQTPPTGGESEKEVRSWRL